MEIRKYDIWVADLNSKIGSEPGITRPVLIIQSDHLNNIHPSTLICPLTSNVVRDINVLRVNTNKELGGLKNDSAVMIDQVRAIDNRRLIRRIGTVPEFLQSKVRENLRVVLSV